MSGLLANIDIPLLQGGGGQQGLTREIETFDVSERHKKKISITRSKHLEKVTKQAQEGT